jgi:hypothetical protein
VLVRFLRTYAQLVENGLVNRVNILLLGAGYDTTYFWLQESIEKGELPESLRGRITFIEVDFQDVVTKKIKVLKTNEKMV